MKSLFVSTGARHSGTGSSMTEFASFTVPDGKIWKGDLYRMLHYAYLDNIPIVQSLFLWNTYPTKLPDGTHLFNLWSR